jgi:DNA-binding CsgD family transcriptional regulator
VKESWNLTARQEEVLALAAAHALTSKEIGRRLGLSSKTVDVHWDRLTTRMEAKTRLQAVLMWERARREKDDATRRESEERLQAQRNADYVHCPTCGGAGFIKRKAA